MFFGAAVLWLGFIIYMILLSLVGFFLLIVFACRQGGRYPSSGQAISVPDMQKNIFPNLPNSEPSISSVAAGAAYRCAGGQTLHHFSRHPSHDQNHFGRGSLPAHLCCRCTGSHNLDPDPNRG
ncbi:hypothetical protein RC52_15255 [Herbaspirillum rubrisubalbicans]|nr:hypothetical protein [Herbaspirillum rubrisubalbicans]